MFLKSLLIKETTATVDDNTFIHKIVNKLKNTENKTIRFGRQQNNRDDHQTDE